MQKWLAGWGVQGTGGPAQRADWQNLGPPQPPITLSPWPKAKCRAREAKRMMGENCAEQLLLAPLYLLPFPLHPTCTPYEVVHVL